MENTCNVVLFCIQQKKWDRGKNRIFGEGAGEKAENGEPKRGDRFTRNKKNSYLMKRTQEVIDIEKRTF